MECLICLRNTAKSFCDNSFLELPVFFCSNCNVYFSGESEISMREKCNEIYSNDFWGDENIWDAKKIIELADNSMAVKCKNQGIGNLFTIDNKELCGTVLMYEGEIIHFSCFSKKMQEEL